MMNPGLAEEAGATTRGIVDALKAQPAVLALTLAQVAMLVFMFYALNAGAKFRETMINQQFEYQKMISELLSRCVVPH